MRRILALSLLVALASCGDSGDTNTGPPSEVASVIVSPAQFTLLIGGTQQLTARPKRRFPAWSSRIASNSCAPPFAKVSGPGETDTVATGSWEAPLTVAVAVPVFPAAVALIVVDPTASAVTTPVWDTVATLSSLLAQVTGLPTTGFPV